MIDAPSGEAPEQAPRWDLVDTESYGGGIRVLAPYLEVLGHVGIYGCRRYVRGATGAPRGRGRAPHPRGQLPYLLTWGPSHQVCFLPKITSPVDFVLF